MKSALADVINQIPKPKVVACSIVGEVIAAVSQTANVKKYNVALQEGCLICVGNASEHTQYFNEPRHCSICSKDWTNDSSLFSEGAKYKPSIFHVRAV